MSEETANGTFRNEAKMFIETQINAPANLQSGATYSGHMFLDMINKGETRIKEEQTGKVDIKKLSILMKGPNAYLVLHYKSDMGIDPSTPLTKEQQVAMVQIMLDAQKEIISERVNTKQEESQQEQPKPQEQKPTEKTHTENTQVGHNNNDYEIYSGYRDHELNSAQSILQVKIKAATGEELNKFQNRLKIVKEIQSERSQQRTQDTQVQNPQQKTQNQTTEQNDKYSYITSENEAQVRANLKTELLFGFVQMQDQIEGWKRQGITVLDNGTKVSDYEKYLENTTRLCADLEKGQISIQAILEKKANAVDNLIGYEDNTMYSVGNSKTGDIMNQMINDADVFENLKSGIHKENDPFVQDAKARKKNVEQNIGRGGFVLNGFVNNTDGEKIYQELTDCAKIWGKAPTIYNEEWFKNFEPHLSKEQQEEKISEVCTQECNKFEKIFTPCAERRMNEFKQKMLNQQQTKPINDVGEDRL